MFYRDIPLGGQGMPQNLEEATLGIIVLNPAESKRLIAKGVAALPEVRRALKDGRLIIARGTTNAFVAEEIMGTTVSKLNYAAGIVAGGELSVVPREGRLEPYALDRGQISELSPNDMLENFDAQDVFIKGANAVDTQGNAGVLVAGEGGGTIGGAMSILAARGSHLIAPVGLEKLIPSVMEGSRRCGTRRLKYTMGSSVGLIPMANPQVVTEVQALWVLTGVAATPVASGGIGGSEGAVVLALEGDEETVRKAFELARSIKGEAPVPKPVRAT